MIATLLTGAAALSVLAAAPAIQPPPASSTQPITGGPTIAGVCVLSPEAVLAGSKVGKAANLRFQQLATESQHQIETERSALETDARTLDAQAKTLPAAQLTQKRQAIADRLKALQAKNDLYGREMEATRMKVVQQISQTAQPLIATAYTAHGCGLLFRRDNVLGGNLANDLTAEVTRNLDTKITSLTFDRETLPAGGGRPAA